MKRALATAGVTGLVAVALTAAAAAESKWVVEQGRSVRDNSRAVSLKLLPEKGTAGLSALCLEGITRVTFLSLDRVPLPPNADTAVIGYRVDGRAPLSKPFGAGENGTVFTIAGERAAEFLKELLGGERLYVRVELPPGPVEIAELPIAGLDEIIGPFREACHW